MSALEFRLFTECVDDDSGVRAQGDPWWKWGDDLVDLLFSRFILSVNGRQVEMVLVRIDVPGGWSAVDVDTYTQRHAQPQ